MRFNLTVDGSPVNSFGEFILLVTISWTFKLFMAWAAYSIATYFAAPMWLVIAITAIAAAQSKITFK